MNPLNTKTIRKEAHQQEQANVKGIRKEARQQERAAHQRPLKVPKGNIAELMHNPYQEKFRNGEFKNDFYHQYNKRFLVKLYTLNILRFLIPALLLHAPVVLIQLVFLLTTDQVVATQTFLPHLTVVYGLAGLLAWNRIRHQLSYYNVMATLGRRNINQLQAESVVYTPQGQKELVVMDHTRMRLNKTHLFPTRKELAMDEQVNGLSADTMANKLSEHFAAKAIADRKQAERGGNNEYDQMVKRYKLRTSPAIQNIIKQVQRV